LTEWNALKAQGAISGGKDRNCIFLFLVGGPSQVDTFDPKPDAPAEVRGPYKPIKTNVKGMYVSEIFPETAKVADKFAIVRSMYHTAAGVHDTGHQMMQTGRLFQNGMEHPHVGCLYGYLKGRKTDLPAHVLLPRPIGNTGGNMPHGQSAGYLGKAYDPFVLNANPADPNFQVRDLLPPDYITTARLERRRKLREVVDQQVAHLEKSGEAQLLDDTFKQAYRLMTSKQAREAFSLNDEPDALRDRYGRNKFGQGCLLARRLIERGVRFVTLNMFETVFNEITWDIHGSAPFSPIECYQNLVGPMFDQGYSTLLADLGSRGLLDDTMVVAMGEFGRTPKINPAGGRDHWPQCWSVLFAGGGVRGGQVIGASDEIGAYPKDRPTQPAEVVASVCHSLGIDPEHELKGPSGQRLTAVESGVKPIMELF
jgi:hypothetical protein